VRMLQFRATISGVMRRLGHEQNQRINWLKFSAGRFKCADAVGPSQIHANVLGSSFSVLIHFIECQQRNIYVYMRLDE
jgi:hypothetical protein